MLENESPTDQSMAAVLLRYTNEDFISKLGKDVLVSTTVELVNIAKDAAKTETVSVTRAAIRSMMEIRNTVDSIHADVSHLSMPIHSLAIQNPDVIELLSNYRKLWSCVANWVCFDDRAQPGRGVNSRTDDTIRNSLMYFPPDPIFTSTLPLIGSDLYTKLVKYVLTGNQ